MKRRAFIQTLGAAAAGGMALPSQLRFPKRLDRIGLELYAVRHEMAKDPEKTLAAIRAIGYTDVELLWSFDNFHRTAAQVAVTLKKEGLRAPSAHISPIDGMAPYEVFVERLDPSVVRLQLDTGNMLIGGGDPMRYLEKYRDRYWSFHLKDVVPDRSSDTRLGKGIFDFKRFLAAVPTLEQKPCYVEDESPSDELAAGRSNFDYLHTLDF